MSARNELRRRVAVLDPMLRSREHMRRAIRAWAMRRSYSMIWRNCSRCAGAPALLGPVRWPAPEPDRATGLDPRRQEPGRPRCALALPGAREPRQGRRDAALLRGRRGPRGALVFRGRLQGDEGILRAALARCRPCWPGVGRLSLRAIQGIRGARRDRDRHASAGLRARAGVLPQHRTRTVARLAAHHGGGLAPETGGRWLDASVGRLRSQLGLIAFHGCEWKLSTIRYAGFKLSRSPGKKAPRLVTLSARDLKLEASPVLGF